MLARSDLQGHKDILGLKEQQEPQVPKVFRDILDQPVSQVTQDLSDQQDIKDPWEVLV
jgi:hypothetical protein